MKMEANLETGMQTSLLNWDASEAFLREANLDRDCSGFMATLERDGYPKDKVFGFKVDSGEEWGFAVMAATDGVFFVMALFWSNDLNKGDFVEALVSELESVRGSQRAISVWMEISHEIADDLIQQGFYAHVHKSGVGAFIRGF